MRLLRLRTFLGYLFELIVSSASSVFSFFWFIFMALLLPGAGLIGMLGVVWIPILAYEHVKQEWQYVVLSVVAGICVSVIGTAVFKICSRWDDKNSGYLYYTKNGHPRFD